MLNTKSLKYRANITGKTPKRLPQLGNLGDADQLA